MKTGLTSKTAQKYYQECFDNGDSRFFIPSNQKIKQNSVNISTARLTAEPDATAQCLTELLYGETFEIFEEKDNWYKGRAVLDGYVGYLPASTLKQPPKNNHTHIVSNTYSHLYPASDLKSRPIKALPLGSRVSIKSPELENGFKSLDSGEWIYEKHLIPIGKAICPNIVEAAEHYLGAPYLWGGRSIMGIDCSGLIQMAFLMTDTIVLRDTDMQAKTIGKKIHGKGKVVPDNLKKGDLVFFPGHVGIMKDEKNILHANAFHMSTIVEPLDHLIDRLVHKFEYPITLVRRP